MNIKRGRPLIRWLSMARLRMPFAGLLAFVLCGALLAQFHRRSAAPPAAAARFDYYVLSLAWAPEICAQPGAAANNPRECGPGSNSAFVVHGLCPELNSGRGPESCGPAKKVATAVVNFILPYMLNTGLIQEEWATHGTCTGLTPSDYFTAVLQARATVQLPVQLTSLQEKANETPSQIEAQFAASNPSFPEGAFRALCRNGAFTEVRVCFRKEPKPQSCTASTGECNDPSIVIRPPL